MDDLGNSLRAVVRRARANASATSLTEPRPATPEVCPDCRGAGFVRRDVPPGDPAFGRALPCRCSRQKLSQQRRDRLSASANLGKLSRMTFDSFNAEGLGLDPARQRSLDHAYRAAKSFAERPDGWLLLMGGYGVGKTHLAAAIANAQIEQGSAPLFVVVPDLLDHLRATFSPSSEVGYDELFHRVRTAPLLILDDLGTQNASSWAQEKLFQIFNYRYNAQLPTVVTTNLRLDEIEMRLRSRLVDPDLTQVVPITAPDYRMGDPTQGQSDLSTLHLLGGMRFDRFDLRATELSDSEGVRLREAQNLVRRFAQEPSGWLVLVGDYGVGKTHLAAAIANWQQDQGKEALFIVVPDLLDHLRATYNPNSPVSYDKRFDQIKRTPLLVLDDLGTQNASPWAQEKLFQLFNHRYMARLPMVITLNSIENVEARLLERMIEMKTIGMGSLIELRVPPYRGRGARPGNGFGPSDPSAPQPPMRRRR